MGPKRRSVVAAKPKTKSSKSSKKTRSRSRSRSRSRNNKVGRKTFHRQSVKSSLQDSLSHSEGDRDYLAELHAVLSAPADPIGPNNKGKAFKPPPRTEEDVSIIARQRALQQQRKEAAMKRLLGKK